MNFPLLKLWISRGANNTTPFSTSRMVYPQLFPRVNANILFIYLLIFKWF